MELTSVLERAAEVDITIAERAEVCAMFSDLARVSAWIEARRVAAVRRLHELPDVQFAEVVVAEATREPVRVAQRSVKRAATLQVCPRFDKALEAGEIVAAHVDALTHALRDVPDDKRAVFVAHLDRLLDVARTASVESFTRAVHDTVRRILSTDDALQRLRRQQRATRLALWTHKATGMVHLRGVFDPKTGAELVARLERARRDLYPDAANLPDTCPTQPDDRDDHLRALALAHVVCHGTPGGRAEALIVTDERTRDEGFHDQSIVDIGIDADIPHAAVQRLAAKGSTVRITMRDGIVTSVDGRRNLDLGRTTRLANLDQRRALRAMYPCCAIPDCPVRFRDCRIHHIVAWDHGGRTDLHNLLPVCSRHHHAIHDHGWTVSLDAARTLTITRPDGTTTITAPPTPPVGEVPLPRSGLRPSGGR